MTEWDESKHPRDGNGKFTEKGGRKEWALRLSTSELKQALLLDEKMRRIPLDFFSLQDKYVSKSDIPYTVFGFSTKERKNTSHHIAHAKEMGFQNQSEYERAAIHFWEHGNGVRYISELRNRYYQYDPKTERFLSIDANGCIRTFMIYKKEKFNEKIEKEKLENV